jgi:hypothetical protein
MLKIKYITLVLLLVTMCEVGAQQEISMAQSQYILSRSKSKVKTYTEHLELLATTDAADIETREFYKQTIYLSFAKEGGKTRIHNDLIPSSFAGSIASETTMQLEAYLNKIAEYYGDSLTITHRNLEASDVYYAANENWYFVKVTTDRKIEGVFRFGNEQINNKREDKVDFYINAFLAGGQMKIGGIYSIQPHMDKEFTKARVLRGSDQEGSVMLIGQPLKFQSASVKEKFKYNKEYIIKWDGGLADDIIRLELIPKDTTKTKRKLFTPMLNSNSYAFVPNKSEKIGDYQFKLHNVSTGRYTQSGYFKISRKIPLSATIGAAALVAGAAVVFWPDPDPPVAAIADPLGPN